MHDKIDYYTSKGELIKVLKTTNLECGDNNKLNPTISAKDCELIARRFSHNDKFNTSNLLC